MKKVVLIVLGVLLLCCASVSLLLIFKGKELFPNIDLSFFTNLSKTSTTNTSTNGEPDLELKVLSYPSDIQTICQEVSFQIEAKNIGTKVLKFSDIEDGKYSFSLLISSTKSIIADTKSNLQGSHNLYVKDFGEISPGQTTSLSFYTKETYIGGEDFGFQNGFNMMQNMGGNGSQGFMFEFYKVNSESSYTILSNRPEFTMDINAFEMSSYGNWSNKICN